MPLSLCQQSVVSSIFYFTETAATCGKGWARGWDKVRLSAACTLCMYNIPEVCSAAKLLAKSRLLLGYRNQAGKHRYGTVCLIICNYKFTFIVYICKYIIIRQGLCNRNENTMLSIVSSESKHRECACAKQTKHLGE